MARTIALLVCLLLPGWLAAQSPSEEQVRALLPGDDGEVSVMEVVATGGGATLREKAKAKLLVTRRKDGKLLLEADDSLSELGGITIDPQAGQVDTVYGALTTLSQVKASPEQAATGPWNGFQWKLEGGSLQTGDAMVAKFALGRMTEEPRCILYYSAKKMVSGGLARSDAILMYPAK